MIDKTVSLPAPLDGLAEGRAKHRRPALSAVYAATASFRPVLVVTVALFAIFSVTQSRFFGWDNLETMLTGVATLWVISIGATFVVMSGGVDLSVGAIAGLVGICLAKVLDLHVPGELAVVIAIAFGAAVGGLVNGMLIGHRGLSFFVVTLGTMTAIGGVVNLWSDTKTFFLNDAFVLNLGRASILGLAVPIWIMVATFLAALWAQRQTYWGRDVYAVGGSITAARLSGIRSSRTVVSVYAVAGGCAALGGILGSAQLGAASPQIDNSIALQAAAAVLLGGTSLAGGRGGVGGTVIGVLFIGILQNGLSIAGVPSFWQQVVTGVILVAAVYGDQASSPRRARILSRLRPARGAESAA